MKKYILLFVFIAPCMSQAQLGGLINRARNKIKEKVDNKVDKVMEPSAKKSKGNGGKATSEEKSI